MSTGEASALLAEEAEKQAEAHDQTEAGKYDVDPYAEEFQPGKIVRRKTHAAIPMSVDDALSEMELVGHDFFLFVNEENNKPSVVYRRRAYDYGLITLGDDNSDDE